MVSSSGLMRTVSFQPSSLASGLRMIPSQPTRLITCTSYRWKWIGCVSTPLCVIFQICVPSVAEAIGVTLRHWPSGRLVMSINSLAGFTYGYRIMFCTPGLRVGRLDAQDAAHAAVVVVEGLAHLVLDLLRLSGMVSEGPAAPPVRVLKLKVVSKICTRPASGPLFWKVVP